RVLLGLVLATLTLTAADQRLYLAAGGKLTVHRIDADTGKLSVQQELDLPGAGPFTRSPDGKFLYVMAGSGKQAAMATLDFNAKGELKLRHQAPINLRAGYLDVEDHGTYIAGNHYGPGKATIWKLKDGIYRGHTVQEIELEQRAHSSIFSPDNQWLLVPATGPNKVFVNRFDVHTGKATPNAPPFAPGPEGQNHARQPRHLVFHPNGNIVYTTNEREKPGVGIWLWDTKKGTLETIQDIITQPKGFDGNITTADLHLTPNNKFLYVSNRDITQRNAPVGRDSIVGFHVSEKNGRLTMIGHTPCERHPRSFTIDTTGRYLYVAGQVDSRLGAYRIDQKTGQLKKIAQYEVGSRPTWVETY
ncbi:MAG: lactonase family protein, partial [Limisphaerales bacterium]